MRDEVIYQCVNMSCARSLPRRVNYCPYCGINQSTALPRAVEGRSHVSDASPAAQTMQSAHVSPAAAAPERISMVKPPSAETLSGAASTAPVDADASCRRGARSKAPVKSGARPAAQPSQSVRNLVADARASMARGDYRAAADKMEVCVAMVDANTRECVELKARAERLDGEMRRCLAQGADWVDARCQ